jgi:hypothetical protein
LSFSSGDSNEAAALQEVRLNSNAIVSDLSDTIWALKKESLPLTAVSDRLKNIYPAHTKQLSRCFDRCGRRDHQRSFAFTLAGFQSFSNPAGSH